MAEDMLLISGHGLVPRSRLNRSYKLEEIPCGHALEFTYTIDGQVVRVDQDILADPKKVPHIKGEIGWLPETKPQGKLGRLKSLLARILRRSMRKR